MEDAFPALEMIASGMISMPLSMNNPWTLTTGSSVVVLMALQEDCAQMDNAIPVKAMDKNNRFMLCVLVNKKWVLLERICIHEIGQSYGDGRTQPFANRL